MARKHENRSKGYGNIISQKEKIKGSKTMQFFEHKTQKLWRQMQEFIHLKSDKKKE